MSEQERPAAVEDTGEAYSLVALKNMVVFPRTRMTLTIAREKSIRAIEEAMMRPDRALIASAQRNPDIDDPQPKELAEYAIVTGGSVEFRRVPWQSAS